MFYLTTHSTHFIYGYMASDLQQEVPSINYSGRAGLTSKQNKHVLLASREGEVYFIVYYGLYFELHIYWGTKIFYVLRASIGLNPAMHTGM